MTRVQLPADSPDDYMQRIEAQIEMYRAAYQCRQPDGRRALTEIASLAAKGLAVIEAKTRRVARQRRMYER